jgi:hypothetical protein
VQAKSTLDYVAVNPITNDRAAIGSILLRELDFTEWGLDRALPGEHLTAARRSPTGPDRLRSLTGGDSGSR